MSVVSCLSDALECTRSLFLYTKVTWSIKERHTNKINVIKSLKVYYLLCVALFSFVIVYYYRLKQLENMSFSLLGGKKNPYLLTLFFLARYAHITFFFYA